MRHRDAGTRLNLSVDHRRALRRNLVTALFQHGRIETTEAKAKAVRGQAEKLITLAKHGLAAAEADPSRGVYARRLAASRLNRWGKNSDGEPVDVLEKLFGEIAPRFKDRPGGYTRIVKLAARNGDAAPMVLLALMEE